ncbi:MAG: hypothetical protein LBI56_00810 [Puniceicoccales bacterium]|jgi:hypothetical protein|nr:hypothetical protein [Puniceicoccales bacterium]
MAVDTTNAINTGGSETSSITLGKIYALLASCVSSCEKGLKSAITKLEKEDDIGQQQMLALQAKIQSWGNLSTACTGALRAVGDALKSTTQNIR